MRFRCVFLLALIPCLVRVGSVRAEPDRVSFVHDVLPILSKQGCSSGECHGSPNGKGGFALSLRAFDPSSDAPVLTRALLGRRVDPLNPDESLLLKKPSGQLPHEGGLRLPVGSESYRLLRTWISEGCQTDEATAAKCIDIDIVPSTARLRLPNAHRQFSVTARYQDGRSRDVTHLAVFTSSHPELAKVRAGRLEGTRRGQLAVVLRYLDRIESVPVTLLPEPGKFDWPNPPSVNFVDELVHRQLQELQILPSERSSDVEFVRRVYLDVIGLLPTVEEVQRFEANADPKKRDKLIDALLARPEFGKFWTLKWGDLLRMSQRQLGKQGLPVYHRWLSESIAKNKRYDIFVRELLTATGNTLDNPPAHFFRTEATTEDVIETACQTFLGVRIQCAKCHNHPFDRWTQDDYYGLSAFFDRLQRKKQGKKGDSFDISTMTEGEVKHPRTGKVMKPWVPGKGILDISSDRDRRGAFVDWLTAKDNLDFAKVEANRIWAHLMGRGIVEPFDDFNDTNPPSNPRLLDALAKNFIEHDYDRKHLIRTILRSRTYQRSSRIRDGNEDFEAYFPHYPGRRLSAEQLIDAVGAVLAVPERFRGHPPETKATQLMAPDLANHDFLKVFGQPERQTACACERSTRTSLPQALALYNGEFLQGKLRNRDNRFHKLIAAKTPPEKILDEMYFAALARKPSAEERRIGLEYLSGKPDSHPAFEDLVWALLNLNEFLFQH